MKICNGTINGTKCKYFDEEFLGCNSKNRSGIIDADLSKCNFYSKYIVPTTYKSEASLSIDLSRLFIDEMKTNEDTAEKELYNSFLSLKEKEQLFVFFVSVEKMNKNEAQMKAYPGTPEELNKTKARYLMSKPSILSAIEEFTNTTTNRLLRIKSSEIALKIMDASGYAIDEMIDDYKNKTKTDNGTIRVRANDIIMANKIHAETHNKYKEQDSNVVSGATITFGDGKTILDVIGKIQKLPEKKIILENN